MPNGWLENYCKVSNGHVIGHVLVGQNRESTRTWTILVAITPFPLLCVFPQRQSPKIPHLQHHFLRIYISPTKTQICSKKENPSLLFFHFFSFLQSPFFLCICISLPKTQFLEGNPFSFLLFPFLFKNQNVSPFLCRISFFHMYATTLILFSLQKYFSYLLWVHVP